MAGGKKAATKGATKSKSTSPPPRWKKITREFVIEHDSEQAWLKREVGKAIDDIGKDAFASDGYLNVVLVGAKKNCK